MHWLKRFFVFIVVLVPVFCFMGCGQTSQTTTVTTTTLYSGSSTTTTVSSSPTTTLAISWTSSFEVFPVSLEAYFEGRDISTFQDQIVDGQQTLITPYMTHFGTNHQEGSGKWYVYPYQTNWMVFSPGRALIYSSEVVSLTSSSTAEVNGDVIYDNTDGSVTLHFDNQKYMELGHMYVLKSLVDQVTASSEGYIIVAAGTHLGYTQSSESAGALDIMLEDSNVDNGLSTSDSVYFENRVCPLAYFNTDIQNTLTNYYDTYIYNKMVEGGKWPQSRIDSDININIDNTIWGRWWYKSGPTPGGDTVTGGQWYYLDEGYGFLIFLASQETNSATFWKSMSGTGNLITEECPSWLGVYNDKNGIGERYVVLLSGTLSSEGVLGMRSIGADAWYYYRFQLDQKTASNYDDELSVKRYDTSAEAEADTSFANPAVYVKDEANGNPEPE